MRTLRWWLLAGAALGAALAWPAMRRKWSQARQRARWQAGRPYEVLWSSSGSTLVRAGHRALESGDVAAWAEVTCDLQPDDAWTLHMLIEEQAARAQAAVLDGGSVVPQAARWFRRSAARDDSSAAQ